MPRNRIKPKTKRGVPALKPGDHVLIGCNRASYPWHWFMARVAWADDRDVLLDRSNINGTERYRHHVPINEVRAVGTVEELMAVKRCAAEHVRSYQNKVDEAEQALGRAREELWAKIDELAASGIAIIPLDEEAADARRATDRKAQEAIEIEEAEIADA